MSPSYSQGSDKSDGSRWYDLFSRGARDWLRHNEKVRDAVRDKLPELISAGDILGSGGNRRVQVPVRFLEHFRFRLSDPSSQEGAGQGGAKPGDVLRQSQSPGEESGTGGGSGEGGLEFLLELKVDDIVDWLWEELELPNLQAKTGSLDEPEYTREGWDRRGARSRLDRRRSVKESIKRRSIQSDGPAFTNEDLRFRQLVKRRQPATQAVVFFSMDVSSSMSARDRQLAKTFFFWVTQGLRRQYTQIELVFVAHTVKAWEFNEAEFFQVKGSGGTVASTAFKTVEEIVSERFDPARYNIYMFYASDGENFSEDRESAMGSLTNIAEVTNFIGYVEVSSMSRASLDTETAGIFKHVAERDSLIGMYALNDDQDVWSAVQAFFRHEVTEPG